MPTRTNPDGNAEKISTEEAAADCQVHIEKLSEQGVKWEDLSSGGYGAYKDKD